MSLFFGKKKTPEEYSKEWKAKLRQSIREVDRNIRDIQREEANVKIQLKLSAKKNDMISAKLFAKELVNSKNAIEKLKVSQAQMNSIILQLDQQLAQTKIMGAMKGSTSVMKMMNSLVSVPQLRQNMTGMVKEMEKAGLMSEMVDDTLDEMNQVAEVDVNKEIESILNQVCGKQLEGVKAGSNPLPNVQNAESSELEKNLQKLKAA